MFSGPVTGSSLRRYDSYSFESDTASMMSSNWTETTSSTVVGPGALTGKALLAFGNAALRVVEKAAIYRRLKVISLFLSGPEKKGSPKSERIYSDLIELSRRDLYPSSVRCEALTLILVQIATFKTTNIVKAIAKWTPFEIFLFLSELLCCIPAAASSWERPTRQAMHIELEKVYISSQLPGIKSKFDSLAVLFGRIATTSQGACEAVAESGFVDMVLSMFLDESLSPPTLHSQMEWRNSSVELHYISEVGCVELLEKITIPINNMPSNAALHQFIDIKSMHRNGIGRLVVMTPVTSGRVDLLFEYGDSGSFQFAIREREYIDSLGHRVTEVNPETSSTLIHHPQRKEGISTAKFISAQHKHSQDDVVIGLMGPVGAGKSSFIDIMTGVDSGAGEITDIRVIKFRDLERCCLDILFVDSPCLGTARTTDVRLVNTMADWLKENFGHEKKLDGVLYFHPILDNRMAGILHKIPRLFEMVCGENTPQNITLVTTMWNEIDAGAGSQQEKQIIETHWKEMLDQGSPEPVRYSNTLDSAWGAIDYFVQIANGRHAEMLQGEIEDMKKNLMVEHASFDWGRLEKLIKKQQEMMLKIQTPSQGQLHEDYDDLHIQLATIFTEMQTLKIPLGKSLHHVFNPLWS